jgi:putative ABC transport system ATP-binding protein
VARALVTRPAVVFADEPTGALDPTTGGRVLRLLREAVDRDGVTVVMVTHDPVAARVSDRLLLLRAGRVVADSVTPDVAGIAARLAAVSAEILESSGSQDYHGTPRSQTSPRDGLAGRSGVRA